VFSFDFVREIAALNARIDYQLTAQPDQFHVGREWVPITARQA
jgi:hypothetical protein